ncbi:flavo protein [Elsinoe ampelina]|uniref:Flavo protein n=1 Tax=Elsinoe ampelina TaxID=302913 RepID=A0A6A6GCT6_9PEZI|nr:flavo protein [Elsinoe ampelina]
MPFQHANHLPPHPLPPSPSPAPPSPTPPSNPPQPPPPFRASSHTSPHPHLLLASTGSVATIKLPLILHALAPYHLSIRLLLTPSSLTFLQSQPPQQPPLPSLLSYPNVDGIHLDAEEWSPPWTRGAPILHIELRRWADAMLVAPLSANTMAKMVAGQADNLVTSVLRAWDTAGAIDGTAEGKERTRTKGGKKRVWVAPAMNTAMWGHPVTGRQMAVLKGEWGEEVGGWVRVLGPVEKGLACGDVGAGAMVEWGEIVREVVAGLGLVRKDEGGGEVVDERRGGKEGDVDGDGQG